MNFGGINRAPFWPDLFTFFFFRSFLYQNYILALSFLKTKFLHWRTRHSKQQSGKGPTPPPALLVLLPSSCKTADRTWAVQQGLWKIRRQSWHRIDGPSATMPWHSQQNGSVLFTSNEKRDKTMNIFFRFLAHTLETLFPDWLFDWPDWNAPASSFTCTFYPHGHFITDWDQSNFIQKKYHSKMVFSFFEQF